MNTPIVDVVNAKNKQFYPTPPALADVMCKMIDWKRVHNILEPSAGKGDLVDCIRNDYCASVDISCVEIDKDLCKLLQADGYATYNGDFMQYNSVIPFDCVVMNPPFRNAVAHLLKALRMVAPNGGQIVCLMNAETLKHLTNSNDGQALQQYINKYAPKITYADAVFVQSEHPTSVRTAILYFDLPIRQHSDIFSNIAKAVEMHDAQVAQEQTSIEISDVIKSLVKQYEVEVRCGLKLIQEYKQLAPKMLKSLRTDKYGYNTGILELRVIGKDASETRYVEYTRQKYWEYLFGSAEFAKLSTQSLLQAYKQQLNNFRAYEFNLQNIYQLRLDLHAQLTTSLESTILEMFDKLTFKHSLDCAGNVQYYNGWRTNDAFKINHKIIYPYANGYDEFFHKFHFTYEFLCFLKDLEHVFDYLGGTAPDACSVRHYENAYTVEFKNVPFRYFRVTQYKKGTAHIEFINETLLKKLNLYGAMHKNWLPNSYGQKAYKSMTAEEQAVIDSFEGENTYMTDMRNAEKRQFLLNLSTQSTVPQLTQQ